MLLLGFFVVVCTLRLFIALKIIGLFKSKCILGVRKLYSTIQYNSRYVYYLILMRVVFAIYSVIINTDKEFVKNRKHNNKTLHRLQCVFIINVTTLTSQGFRLE